MSALKRAMDAANARKAAGLNDDRSEGIVLADTEAQDRAVFSGFDIEYGELVATSTEVGALYTQTASNMGLLPLFTSAWCDGLLTGLMLASQAKEEDASR